MVNSKQLPGGTSGKEVSGPEAWGIMEIGQIHVTDNKNGLHLCG